MQNTCTLTLDQIRLKTYSYDEYMNLMETYSRLGVTSGNDQGESKINFTKLNFARMKRLNKTIVLNPELVETVKSLTEPQCWTVITEAWCGDGAQNIPALAKIAAESDGKINFQLVFRDDNPGFMNQYLTNGGQAIPKLISRDKSGDDLFCWGPRPEAALAIMRNWKANPNGVSKSEADLALQTWYNENKQNDLMQEIHALLLSVSGC